MGQALWAREWAVKQAIQLTQQEAYERDLYLRHCAASERQRVRCVLELKARNTVP